MGAGYFYAGTNLLSLIWCWFRLPETKVSSPSTAVFIYMIADPLRTDLSERLTFCLRTESPLASSSTPKRTVSSRSLHTAL